MSKSKITKLDDLARTRLSKTFFMRDFLYSETAATLGLINIPSDLELAIKAGERLCQNVLEPIQDVWGRIHVRSAFRSEEVNQAGNVLGANCASNTANYASHIWDKRDGKFMGATACIVIPAYVDYYNETGDWQSLAWWIHYHIPSYQKMTFYKEMCAFNIRWYENPNEPKEIKTSRASSNFDKKYLLKNGETIAHFRDKSSDQRYEKCNHIIDGMKSTKVSKEL
jgi:hypothetical protein